MDRGEGSVSLNDKDLGEIWGITEGNTLFGEAVIDFILRLVDHNDTVSGNAALNLEKERVFDEFIGKP